VKGRWHILVVDDEEAMTESLSAWLREDGYSVDTASSGREAVERARAREYAIYFVDLKMPGGLDGIETMMEIRKQQPEASVIVITAYATVDTAIIVSTSISIPRSGFPTSAGRGVVRSTPEGPRCACVGWAW